MSATDRFLSFAFSHQTVIIELLFAVILAIVVVWLFLHLRQENSGMGEGHHVEDIEAALKRVLQNTDIKMSTTADAVQMIKDDEDDDLVIPDISLSPPSASSAASRATPVNDGADISKLKLDLDDKTKKLVELEKSLRQAKEEVAKAAVAGSNTEDLQNKLKTLESRLAEYEIIEDDIANLSIYKEENVRLRAELERLKRAGPDVNQASSVNTGAAPAAAVASSDSPGPASTSTPTPVPVPSAVPAVTPMTPPSETATAAAVPASPAESSDIAAAMNETMAAISAAPVEPPLSTIEKAKADAIDSDKLLKEFDSLVSAAKKETPKPGEEKKSGDKLIEEFENFMKGNNS